MDAEKYFLRLIHADRQIDADLEELKRLETLMTSIPSSKINAGIKGKGGHSSRVENLVTKFVDLSATITDEINALVDLKAEAREILQQIKNPQQKIVLQEYYFNGRTIESIACSIYLSYRRVQVIKKEGLESAQIILNRIGNERVNS